MALSFAAPSIASTVRLDQLLRLTARVASEGSTTLRAQAERLGVPVGALRNYLTGFPVPDDVARDIEWTLHLPTGWLDGVATTPPIPSPSVKLADVRLISVSREQRRRGFLRPSSLAGSKEIVG